MKTWVMISFPYGGYGRGSARERNFRALVDSCCSNLPGCKPLVVLNRDTEQKPLPSGGSGNGSGGQAQAFLDEFGEGGRQAGMVDIMRVWSVDTCQMWLAGWGRILDRDDVAPADHIATLPGDIDIIADTMGFLHQALPAFLKGRVDDIVIGDFTAGEALSAKDLIDRYGTLPLLANWFPDTSKALLEKHISKPRSEFLNVRCEVLEELLLRHRKFAYEQTLNLLIRAWDGAAATWRYSVGRTDLGVIEDSREQRKFRDCLDQIERTERMLRLIWRETHEPDNPSSPAYAEFVDRYTHLDRFSTAVRETAVITLRNLLGDEAMRESALT